jgi:hypothetical protein
MQGPIHSDIPGSLCQSVDIVDNQAVISRTAGTISSMPVKTRSCSNLELSLLTVGTSYSLVNHLVELSLLEGTSAWSVLKSPTHERDMLGDVE